MCNCVNVYFPREKRISGVFERRFREEKETGCVWGKLGLFFLNVLVLERFKLSVPDNDNHNLCVCLVCGC
jgi:hypothetical protein